MIETVSPEMAREWLANSRNQPIKQDKLTNYLQDMENGNWKGGEEGRAVILDNNHIRNGFHRLHAVVKLGRPVNLLVERR